MTRPNNQNGLGQLLSVPQHLGHRGDGPCSSQSSSRLSLPTWENLSLTGVFSVLCLMRFWVSFPNAASAGATDRPITDMLSDYATDFCTLMAENKWNPAAGSDALFQGLSESVKAQMRATGVPDNLESILRLKKNGCLRRTRNADGCGAISQQV